MTLSELRAEFEDKEFIPYQALLRTDEWAIKRRAIVQRDGARCTVCGKGATIERLDDLTGTVSYVWVDDQESSDCEENRLKNNPVEVVANRQYHLEVHHDLYIQNRLPWEYDDGDLVTFCNWCHATYHEQNEVKVYTEDMMNEIRFTPCKRCNGVGWFRNTER